MHVNVGRGADPTTFIQSFVYGADLFLYRKLGRSHYHWPAAFILKYQYKHPRTTAMLNTTS